MSWYSIREYTDRVGISVSTVRRQIREGRIFAKKFGQQWYIRPQYDFTPSPTEPRLEEAVTEFAGASLAKEGGSLQSVVDFSSKALHHYLMISEKLLAEKDLRLTERERALQEKKQEIVDLETYVQMLERELRRKRQREEGRS